MKKYKKNNKKQNPAFKKEKSEILSLEISVDVFLCSKIFSL
jgi:hypothetical protein